MKYFFCKASLILLFVIGGLSQQTSAQITSEQKSMNQIKVEIVARLKQMPGNIAVTPDGRIFLSLHPFGEPEFRVVELLSDGNTRPFPNSQWSGAPKADGVGLTAVIGIRADKNGVVWMLDMGSKKVVPKLVAWNTKTDKLERVITLPANATVPNSFHQDFVIDWVNNSIIIADTGRADLGGASTPALVIVNLKTGEARRVFENHPSLQPEEERLLVDNQPVTASFGGKMIEPKLGLNPITIDAAAEFVYYGAMNGTNLYRVRTADLSNSTLSTKELAERVKRFGAKPLSDGIIADNTGNVYSGDVNNNAIGVTLPRGGYRRLFQDEKLLRWVDGFSTSSDGYIYATVNQLHRHPTLNGGKDGRQPPYLIIRFKPFQKSLAKEQGEQ